MNRVDLHLGELLPDFKLYTQLSLVGKPVNETQYHLVMDAAHFELEHKEHHQRVSQARAVRLTTHLEAGQPPFLLNQCGGILFDEDQDRLQYTVPAGPALHRRLGNS
jgi:hypothetical protein